MLKQYLIFATLKFNHLCASAEQMIVPLQDQLINCTVKDQCITSLPEYSLYWSLCTRDEQRIELNQIFYRLKRTETIKDFLTCFHSLKDGFVIDDSILVDLLICFSKISAKDCKAYIDIMQTAPFFLNGDGSDGSIFLKLAQFLKEQSFEYWGEVAASIKIFNEYELFLAIPLLSTEDRCSFEDLYDLLCENPLDSNEGNPLRRCRHEKDLYRKDIRQLLKRHQSNQDVAKSIFQYLRTPYRQKIQEEYEIEKLTIDFFYTHPYSTIDKYVEDFAFDNKIPLSIFEKYYKYFDENIADTAYVFFQDYLKEFTPSQNHCLETSQKTNWDTLYHDNEEIERLIRFIRNNFFLNSDDHTLVFFFYLIRCETHKNDMVLDLDPLC